MQSYYSINPLIKSFINTENKYIYLSSVNGKINLENNIWDFNLKTYIYTNSFLPDNIYEANITLPFSKISDVQLIKTTNNFDIEGQNNLDEYECDFQVDIASSNLLSSIVTSINIPISINYFMNADVLSNISIMSDALNIAEFSNELQNSTKKMNFNYFNSIEVTSNICFPFPNTIKIDSENGYSYVGNTLQIHPNTDYSNNLISSIASISSSNIYIQQISSIVSYNVSGKSSSFSFIDNTKKQINDEQTLLINNKYIYSSCINSFIENNNSVWGIWFTNGGSGNIQNIVKISDENSNVLTIAIKNKFDFKTCLGLSKINLKKDTFELDNGFLEEVYND